MRLIHLHCVLLLECGEDPDNVECLILIPTNYCMCNLKLADCASVTAL